MASAPPPSQPPQWSADGRWWWDGQRWIPATGGVIPNQPKRFPWGIYGLIGCSALALLLVVVIVAASLLASYRSNTSTVSRTPSASPIAGASLSDLQVVAQGMAGPGWPLAVVIKDTSAHYAYAVKYLATFYNAQGAQIGTVGLDEVDVLPGETVAVGNGVEPDLNATPARFTLSLDTRPGEGMQCAYPVTKPSRLPTPIASVSGTWKGNPQNPNDEYDSMQSGTVAATLQVPSLRHGLVAQALLFDSAGHLAGFGTQTLTSAQGVTPVLIPLQDSQVVLGPDPWGPVATATVSAHDVFNQASVSAVFGECQAL